MSLGAPEQFMRGLNPLPLLIITLVAASISPHADAGLAPMEFGSMAPATYIRPVDHPTIRLDEEKATIRLRRWSYSADAVFTFVNMGGATRVWVGFLDPSSAIGLRPACVFVRFQVWLNGQSAKFEDACDLMDKAEAQRCRGNRRMPRWMVCHVTFPGSSKTTIRISYESRGKFALYSFKTGGNWHGRVGRASLVIDSSDLGGKTGWRPNKHSLPGLLEISPNLHRYELRDFEPSSCDSVFIDLSRDELARPLHKGQSRW